MMLLLCGKEAGVGLITRVCRWRKGFPERQTLTVRERGAVYVQNGGTAEGALGAGSDPRAVSPPPAAGLGAPHPVRCDGTCAASQKLMFFLWQKALLFPISKWEILRSMFLNP